MTADELDPAPRPKPPETPAEWCEWCDFIARVRADERERIAQALARIIVDSGCVARCDPTSVWPRGWTDADGVFPSDLTEALPELDAAIARGEQP